jgi:hypothetical protein
MFLVSGIFSARYTASIARPFLLAVVSAVASNAQPILSFTIPPASPSAASTYVAYAWCIDGSGNFVSYCNPIITWGYNQYTGGHVHDDPTHISDNYSGYATTSGTNTTANNFQVTYHATRTGETEYVQSCAPNGTGCSSVTAYITYPNLQQLYAGYNFTLIGDKPWHPDNHWMTQSALNSLVATVQSYSAAWYTYPGYVITGVNDEALPNGGVFDICETSTAACLQGVLPWQPPHANHDYGQAADFRANGDANSILSAALGLWTGNTGYCWTNGFTHHVALESPGTSNQHIHCDAQ